MRDADGPEMRDGRWPMRGAKAEAEGRKRETESATRSLVRCRSVAVGVRLSGAWSVPVARVYYIPEVICDFVHTCDRVCGVPVVVGSRVPMRDECMYSMTPMRNGIPPSPTVISKAVCVIYSEYVRASSRSESRDFHMVASGPACTRGG